MDEKERHTARKDKSLQLEVENSFIEFKKMSHYYTRVLKKEDLSLEDKKDVLLTLKKNTQDLLDRMENIFPSNIETFISDYEEAAKTDSIKTQSFPQAPFELFAFLSINMARNSLIVIEKAIEEIEMGNEPSGFESIKAMGAGHDYIPICNTQLYYSFRDAISIGRFEIEEGELWPSVNLSRGNLEAKAYMKPNDETPILDEQVIIEMQETMSRKVMNLIKQGDLAADVFDIITGVWLQKANHHEASVNVCADDFLKFRNLMPKRSGTGRRGGYRDEQRQEIMRHIDTLSHTWITVNKMDVVEETPTKSGKKKTKISSWGGESKAVVLSSRFGQFKVDGTIDAYAWRIRPGDVFSRFLFGPGRQTALLSQKALAYDFYRQKWEKRLARYLAWNWRIDSSRSMMGISVHKLIEAIQETVDTKNPNRTKERLETAFDQLTADGVITSWQYESNIDEAIIGTKGWVSKWREWKIILEPPKEILDQYLTLNKSKEQHKKRIPQKTQSKSKRLNFSLGENIKLLRRKMKKSIVVVSDEIGISPASLSKLERDIETGSKVQRRAEKWLANQSKL